MQDRNLNAALQIPARQLTVPQGAVPQPDTTGQRAQLEYSDRLVGQLSAFGVQISEKEMADTAAVHATNARIMVQQGKTLKEIHASDEAKALQVFGETATMAGAEAELARINANQFKSSEQQALREGQYANLTPTQYREALVRRYAEGLDAMPEGGSGRALLSELGSQAITDLSANHMQAHYEHKQKLQLSATTKTMYGLLDEMGAAKNAGDKVALKQLYRDMPSLLAQPLGMSDENYAALLAGVTTQALAEGNAEVYEVVKKLNPTFDPDQRQAIENANHANDVRVAQRGSIESATAMANISTAAANGASAHRVGQMIAEYNTKYPLAPLSEGQMAGYLTQTATVQASKAAAQQAKQQRNQDVMGGSGVYSQDEGSKALADLRQVAPDQHGYMTVWKQSPYTDKQMKQELSNGLNLDIAITDGGEVSPSFMTAYGKYLEAASYNEDKARGMLSESQLVVVDAMQVTQANGGNMAEVVTQMQEAKRNPSAFAPPSKKEVAEAVKDEDFGTGKWTDTGPLNWIPGTANEVDEGKLDAARVQYVNEVHKLTQAGVPLTFAQNTAKKNQTNRLHRVNGILVDTNGADLNEFGITSVEKGLTVMETELRTNKVLATTMLGSELSDDWEVVDASVVPGSKGRPSQFKLTLRNTEDESERPRVIPFTPDDMKEALPRHTPAAIEQRRKDERAALDENFRKASEEQKKSGFRYHSAIPE
ncbi:MULTISPECIES: hypothetical protein [unclassified Aeromonas]|uniref:hypothetical protein n=1 Tax=unclassified Aeromonas TaxID=257493 RepID=UPI00352841F3